MRLDVLASVAAWRALCEADLRTAQLILGAADATPEMFGLACFHAQQAAEKMLKALLTACLTVCLLLAIFMVATPAPAPTLRGLGSGAPKYACKVRCM